MDGASHSCHSRDRARKGLVKIRPPKSQAAGCRCWQDQQREGLASDQLAIVAPSQPHDDSQNCRACIAGQARHDRCRRRDQSSPSTSPEQSGQPETAHCRQDENRLEVESPAKREPNRRVRGQDHRRDHPSDADRESAWLVLERSHQGILTNSTATTEPAGPSRRSRVGSSHHACPRESSPRVKRDTLPATVPPDLVGSSPTTTR